MTGFMIDMKLNWNGGLFMMAGNGVGGFRGESQRRRDEHRDALRLITNT